MNRVLALSFTMSALTLNAAPSTTVNDTSSDNIRVLRAEVTDTRVVDSHAQGVDPSSSLLIDVTACTVHEKITGGVRYDCSSEVSKLSGLPLAKKVYVDALVSGTTKTPQQFYCYLVKLDTITRAKVMPTVKEVGFYIDLQFVTIPKSELYELDQMTMADGETGIVHEFAFVQRCANEANPKTQKWYAEFKPYLITEIGGKTYRDWDNAFDNYKMYEEISTIDRTDEIIDGISPQ